MPFAGYKDFKDCVKKNQSKDNPAAYCAVIKRKVEGDFVDPHCVVAEMQNILKWNKNIKLKIVVQKAYSICHSRLDFANLTHNNYLIISKISHLLYENSMEPYPLDSLTAAQGISTQIEPLKSLAEAATSGKKTSETIDKIGYFNNMLEVEFHGGGKYVYFVGPDFYKDFAAASSKGSWLWDNLRGRDPGLVYPAGPNKTPGGVGGSIQPYAKVGGKLQSGEKQDPQLAFQTRKAFTLSQLSLESLQFFDPEGKRFGKAREKIKTIQAKQKQKKFKKIALKGQEDMTVDDTAFDKITSQLKKDKNLSHKDAETQAGKILSAAKGSSKKKKQKKILFKSKHPTFVKKSKNEMTLVHRTDNNDISVSSNPNRLIPTSISTVENGAMEWVEGKNRFELRIKKGAKILELDANKNLFNFGKEEDTPINRGIEAFKLAKYNNIDIIKIKNVHEVGTEYAILNKNIIIKKEIVKHGEFEGLNEEEVEGTRAFDETDDEYDLDTIKKIKEEDEIKETFKKTGDILDKQRAARKNLPKSKKTKQKRITDLMGTLVDFNVCPDRFKLKHDYYHSKGRIQSDFAKTLKKHGVILNDTTLFGMITRAGPFDYDGKIMYKEWDNIKEHLENRDMLPLFGSRYYDSHKELDKQLIGYTDNFIFDNENEQVFGFSHTFKDIAKLSDLRDPKDLSVSLSMYDLAPPDSNIQQIAGFRHAAISLNNLELDRCSSIDGYSRCTQSPVIADFINKKPNGSSSQETDGPRKIIKQIRDLIMPDSEAEVNAKIEKFLASLDIKEDSASVVTGDEVPGQTHKDEWVSNCVQQTHSPEACEKAWTAYQAQGKPTDNKVDKTTYGFKDKKVEKLGDFDTKLKTLEDMIGKQSAVLKKYEDFFTAEQKKKEDNLKAILKLPLSEEKHDLIEKLDFDSLSIIQPIIEAMIEEHPEILPTNDTASKIQEVNTSRILQMIDKSKNDMTKADDMVKNIREDAIKRMEAKWSVKQVT